MTTLLLESVNNYPVTRHRIPEIMEATPIRTLSRGTEEIHKNALIAGVQAQIQTDTSQIKSELLLLFALFLFTSSC
jgi:hypothetical protein